MREVPEGASGPAIPTVEEPPPGRPWPQMGRARRLGPVALVVLALVGAGVVATVHRSGGVGRATGGAAGGSAAGSLVPPNYSVAARQGRVQEYRWGPRCDRTTGLLEVPVVDAPPCVPLFSGANGGSTWNGVTAKTINVVYYEPPPGDLTAALQGIAGTPATTEATARAYVAMLNKIVEMYGRTVHLAIYHATGTSTDSVAAEADAVRVADQYHAFASIGAPAQTPAYQDELARLHVMCISCGYSATYADFRKDAPYMWAALQAPETLLDETFAYVLGQLNGRDAIWAGDPGWHRRRRSFAIVHYEQNPPTAYKALTSEWNRKLAAAHFEAALKAPLTYLLDLATLPEQAATIAAKLKASGATTVIFLGDPIMPIYLTKACAAIGYFPEWVITGTAFTDTSTLGRLYDQREWAHAFGISTLPVPSPIQSSDAYRLYRWWFGGDAIPPATKTAEVVLAPLLQLFTGIELAGPHLTPYTFATGLFRSPPRGGQPTAPLVAYGFHGAPPRPSYASPADYTFVWYDATAKGPDEEGTPGTGLIRYVGGGARYRAGTSPRAQVPMFSLPGTVTSLPGAAGPTDPPWPGSPAARG